MIKNALIIIAAILCLSVVQSCRPDMEQDPLVQSLPLLEIKTKAGHLVLLRRKRQEALRDGMLMTGKNDYVPAQITCQGKSRTASIRLKGDWLDHLKGSKWSLRIKLDSSDALWGMQRFSIQHPRTRSYLDEWVFHQLLQEEGILSPKYTFVQVRFNGKYKGIYALEEHFDRLLLEKQERREAPILKFAEDGFWEAQQYRISSQKNITPYIPDFEAAEIEVFQKGRTYRDTALRQNYLYARQKMQAYRMAEEAPLDLLDTAAMAKLYALCDVAQAYHALRWHNLRFYYNPFTAKLEPLVYDAYGSTGPYRWFSKPFLGFYSERYSKVYFREEYIIFNLLNAPSFRKSYLHYLQKFSEPAYLDTFFKNQKPQIQQLEKAIQKEFYDYKYDWSFLQKGAEKINEQIKEIPESHPPFEYTIYAPIYDSCRAGYPLKSVSLKTRLAKGPNKRMSVFLSNYYCKEITIMATGPKKSKPLHPLNQPLLLSPFDVYNQGKEVELILPQGDRYIFYTVPENPFWYRKKITAWPGELPPDSILQVRYDIDASLFKELEDTLYILAGKYQVSDLQYLPADRSVVVEAGVEIDFVNGGGFVFQGPLLMRGKKQQPIRIYSSDGKSSGWQIINASGEAQLAWVNFENLSALRQKGHWLSGGISIYKTNVYMSHCHFSHFRSEDALNIVSTKKGTLKYLSFQDCRGDALDIDFSRLQISDCTFDQIGGDALDCSGGQLEAQHLDIRSIQDKGISLGEQSQAILRDITIAKARIGLAVKDGSKAEVKQLIIQDSPFGLAVFNKKNYFHPAKLELSELTCTNIPKCLAIESAQSVEVDGMQQQATDSIGVLRGLFYGF